MQLTLSTPLAVIAMMLTPFVSSSTTVCKYSVRDVGFVNVHGQPWHLKLLLPASAEGDAVSQMQSVVKEQLADSNVTHEWLRENSIQGQQLHRLFKSASADSLIAALYGPDEKVLRLPLPPNATASDLKKTLQTVVASPIRERVLDQVSSALCVILVVECGTPDWNQSASNTAKAAAEQITRQMWAMEKPTKIGPVVETVAAEHRGQEHWLLTSLGLDPQADEPQLVVVYGQGRRLGDPLTGTDIQEGKIVQLASLCGHSCECDLDRDWLYGVQMIHLWDKKRAAKAEESLDFDPAAALVVAEVSGIIRKTGQGKQKGDSLIGSGLVIHDFSELEKKAGKNPSNAKSAKNAAGKNGSKTGSEPATKETASEPSIKSAETDQVGTNTIEQDDTQGPWSWGWILLVVMAGVVVAVAIFAVTRGRE